MEKVIDAVIAMLNGQGHRALADVSKGKPHFEIDGFAVTRHEIMELVNGTYSVEELLGQLRGKRKESR